MRAEKSQAVLKTGQNRHEKTPSLEPPFMVGCFFISLAKFVSTEALLPPSLYTTFAMASPINLVRPVGMPERVNACLFLDASLFHVLCDQVPDGSHISARTIPGTKEADAFRSA